MAVTTRPRRTPVTGREPDLLRFTTAGSVDDGKSTLIGRLLYDAKQVADDQLEHLRVASVRRGGQGTLDLSLLTDGLRAEREQGITIDVAYRHFATPARRFVIADVPGHKQYTRNMVTGASTADLSVVLLDARQGATEQSKRHAFISALLRIPHLVVCLNKMDLVDYDELRFAELVDEFGSFVAQLDLEEVSFIPISALHGDNVVTRSTAMEWYRGPTLLEHLEDVSLSGEHAGGGPPRFPVQWVIRGSGPGAGTADPGAAPYRGYAGQLASGAFSVGQAVTVLPEGQQTSIAGIDTYDGPLAEAVAPQSVTLRLADDLDVSRGDLIAPVGELPVVARELEADVCWMSEQPLRRGRRLAVGHTTRDARAVVTDLRHRVDVETLEREEAVDALALNDIGRIALRLSTPVAFDPYRRSRATGSLILIDEDTNATVAGAMIVDELP